MWSMFYGFTRSVMELVRYSMYLEESCWGKRESEEQTVSGFQTFRLKIAHCILRCFS